jgi:hypothetical protein
LLRHAICEIFVGCGVQVVNPFDNPWLG